MKNTRKLIPALAMLLVSAVMMSTASFAWFTMNSTVEATGMQVTAVAPASLWISQDGNAWSSSINLADSNMADQLVPVRPKNGDTETQTEWDAWVFEKLDSASAQKVTSTGAAPADAVYEAAVSEDNKNYFFMDAIKIKLDGQDTYTAPVNVAVAVSSDDAADITDGIWRALRVAVVTEDEVLVFQFDNDADGATEADDKINYSVTAGQAATKYTDAQNLGTFEAGGAVKDVVVYAWFDGADSDCINANAYTCDNFRIDLKFTLGNNAVEEGND